MKRYGKIKDVMELCSCGRNKGLQIGKDSGALVHIGRATVYDLQKIIEYLDSLRRQQQTVNK